MKLKIRIDQTNMLVFVLIARRLRKHLSAKTASPLLRQCQKALNDISTRHTVVLHRIPGHVGIKGTRGNEIVDKLARDGSVQKFVGPVPFLGVSRQNI
jgi:ribonuclease HI